MGVWILEEGDGLVILDSDFKGVLRTDEDIRDLGVFGLFENEESFNGVLGVLETGESFIADFGVLGLFETEEIFIGVLGLLET